MRSVVTLKSRSGWIGRVMRLATLTNVVERNRVNPTSKEGNAMRLGVFVLILLLDFGAEAQEDSWWEAVGGVSMPSLVAEGWKIMAFHRQ